MTSEYKRGLNLSHVRLIHQGNRLTLPTLQIKERLGVQGIIRIPNSDYSDTHQEGSVLTHFNLPIGENCLGLIVALARILEYGYFKKSGCEQLPLLSFENVWIAQITDLATFPSLQSVPPHYFRDVIGGCSTTEELHRLILSRYRNSLPDSNDEEILNQGVTVRCLKLLNRTSLSLDN